MNSSHQTHTGRTGPVTATLSSTKPKPMRLVVAATPKELKRQFAKNLDYLFRCAGYSRKEAAEEIGLPYPLVRRLASAGVSRVDERNQETLQKIVDYFALFGVNDLWLDNMMAWLLTADEGRRFVEKFRPKLTEYRQKQMRAAEGVDQEEVQLIGDALGEDVGTSSPAQAILLDKVRAILSSERAAQFECLIDDYYELAVRTKAEAS